MMVEEIGGRRSIILRCKALVGFLDPSRTRPEIP